ncbi:hypothetical protein P7K49_036316, partial [Saguinus oedipus]
TSHSAGRHPWDRPHLPGTPGFLAQSTVSEPGTAWRDHTRLPARRGGNPALRLPRGFPAPSAIPQPGAGARLARSLHPHRALVTAPPTGPRGLSAFPALFNRTMPQRSPLFCTLYVLQQ